MKLLPIHFSRWMMHHHKPGKGGGMEADTQLFSTAGADTWSKPSGCSFVYVMAVYGGTGGQGGSPFEPGVYTEGASGAGGYIFEYLYPAELVPATVDITVGAGGAGGAGTAGETKNDGAAGEASYFKAVGKLTINYTTVYEVMKKGGNGGSDGAGVDADALLDISETVVLAAGGTGGAAAAGGNPAGDGGDGNDYSYFGTGGGGGGAGDATHVGGNGGNGINGSGGGGGGIGSGANAGGDGGDGGDGFVVVIAW